VFCKKLVTSGLLALLSLALFCGDEPSPTAPPVSSAPTFGTFKLRLVPADSITDNAAYTALEGAINDGPSVPDIVFQEIMKDGECKLFKAISPFCAGGCGSNGKCIAEDSCQPYPSMVSAGKVTVNGLKKSNEKISFTMDPSSKFFYQMVNVPLDYPPFAEGDSITFVAAGSSSIAPFTVSVRGIGPLVVLNKEVLLEDGKPITFLWEKPKVAGISTISIRINISYHGGTKGEIQCEGADDGELTVPAALLDKLKTYGIAGWPVADITRKSVVTSESAKVKIITETTFTQGLTIPGVVSCNENEECPSGNCVDRKCQ
jgi:hypothetical protein